MIEPIKIEHNNDADTKFVKFMNQNEIENCLATNTMAVYGDVFQDGVLPVLFETDKRLIIISDHYCVNPSCKCNEVFVSFAEMDKVTQTTEENFMLICNLKTKKYKIGERRCSKDTEIEYLQQFDNSVWADMTAYQERYNQLKELAQSIIGDENKPYKSESIKIGRNDQCPCGSGKKYKRCCGR